MSQTLAAALEDMIWSEQSATLSPAEPAIRALMSHAGCNLTTLLAEISDETLALAVQRGFLRKLAFEELLVNRLEKSLLRWFYSHSGSAELAQDLTQELYLKLLTGALGTYNPDRPFRTWLWTLVHNLWVGEWRRRRKLAGLPELEQLASGPNPVEEAASRELEDRLEVAMAELPYLQQRVLREAMSGSSADRTAQLLGLSKTKVFQLLFKARRAVEQALGLRTGGPPNCAETLSVPHLVPEG